MNMHENVIRERDEALLSMDEQKLRDYFFRHNGKELPDNPSTLLIIIHKARTGATSLPMFERAASAFWLFKRGFMPLAADEIQLPNIGDADYEKYVERLREFRDD